MFGDGELMMALEDPDLGLQENRSIPTTPDFKILLENGGAILLESGGFLLLEAAP